MSTYTDLKNTIKETVVVNYTDRNTNQEVHFLNENNEYFRMIKNKKTKHFFVWFNRLFIEKFSHRI